MKKKKKDFTLKTITDVKVYILFLLDHLAYPIDHSSLIGIISESTHEISLGYDEALRELADSEHIVFDEIDGEKYYMVSEMGKMVAKELYDTLDKELLEKTQRTAGKYISFTNSGVKVRSTLSEREDKRYTVNLIAEDGEGELMNLTLTLKSRNEAERIMTNFENRPESIYRGVLISSTGFMEYFS
jgi:hypothetical protein